MGTLCIVVHDPLVKGRLAKALDRRFRLVAHDDWQDFEEQAGTLRPQAIVVDPFAANGPPTIQAVVERARVDEFGIVACSDFHGRGTDLYKLGLAGVSSILMAPDPGSRSHILKAVERAIATSVANAVVDRLGDRAPPLALDAIHWAIGHATQGATAEDLARGLAATPKALGNQLRRNNLPPARRTMLWGRLLYAAWALHRGDESVERLAQRLGYSTRSGLTKAISEAVGSPPTTLAAGDARAPVVKAYLDEIYAA